MPRLLVIITVVEERPLHRHRDRRDVIDVDVVPGRMNRDDPSGERRLVVHSRVLAIVQIAEQSGGA